MPLARAAGTYPAHDEHTTEAVSVGIDPYDAPSKASIFSINYSSLGLLPVFLVVTNDGDQPITLMEIKAQLVTGDRAKLSPVTEDDIYRRLSHPSARVNPYPLPFPTKVKGSVSKQARDEIQTAQFAARAIEPHTTHAGFLFFDVSGVSAPLSGTHFYLNGVHNSKGDELMYFDVDLSR
ncbi:MAG: hypothetical protein JOY93_11380 [Acidobacteriales bacterium]|nr:hypothetical protein [Terriglobales bacterium]